MSDVSKPNRTSNERRENAKFLGICKTCFDFGDSRVGEVADFVAVHMCEQKLTLSQKRGNLQKVISSLEISLLSESAAPSRKRRLSNGMAPQ